MSERPNRSEDSFLCLPIDGAYIAFIYLDLKKKLSTFSVRHESKNRFSIDGAQIVFFIIRKVSMF